MSHQPASEVHETVNSGKKAILTVRRRRRPSGPVNTSSTPERCMDCWVKPGNDERKGAIQFNRNML
jgi:hypothetical protein